MADSADDALVLAQRTLAYVDAAASCANMFFDEKDIVSLKQNIACDGLLRNVYSQMKSLADGFMSAVTVEGYPVEDWQVGRHMQSHVLMLALTARLSEDAVYREKAISILCECAGNTSVQDFNRLHGALGIGDAAHAYAVGYDWLKPYMTEAQRNLVRGEVSEFGQWLYEHSTGTGAAAAVAPWGVETVDRSAWNWNGVTHGSLGLCALALGGHRDWLDRAVYRVKQFFQYSIDATGCAYEGVSYLGYGLHNSITFATALERMEKTDIISLYPALKKTPNYILQQTLPKGGEIATINQTNKILMPGEGVYRIINKYRDPVGLWAWLNLLGTSQDRPSAGCGSYGQHINSGASLPYILLWTDASLQPVSPETAGLAAVPLTTFFSRGQLSMRDGWDAYDSLVTFTSGEGRAGCHMHADANSFTFTSRSEKFFIDYPGSSKKPSTEYHNAILVDGEGQFPLDNGTVKQGQVTQSEDRGNCIYVKGDATQAYRRAQPGFDHAHRQILFRKRAQPYLLIVDDIQKDGRAHRYVSKLHTAQINSVTTSQNRALITGGVEGNLCDVQFLWPQSGLTVTGNNGAFKRIDAAVTTIRAKIVVLVTALNKEECAPTVTCTGSIDSQMEIRITFSDGSVDAVAATLSDLALSVASHLPEGELMPAR